MDEATPGGENSANWNSTGAASAPPDLTDVGGYTLSSSYYGTYDQSGNVMEWTDTLGNIAASRWQVGGSWTGSSSFMNGATLVNGTGPSNNKGFRVVHFAVPEPASWVLGLMGLALLSVFRRLG
ncbi:MAG: hypothetical protein CMJ81_09095 [Planctomycetaceae bacterium]|nr:hypothetical protein [Planctomycetaceae bacterium]